MKTTEQKTAFYKILGYTDSVNVCDCCGREDLKGTIKMEGADGLAFFGVVCAAKMAGITEKAVRDSAKLAGEMIKATAREEIKNSIEYLNHEENLREINSRPGGVPFPERMQLLGNTLPQLQAKRIEINEKYGFLLTHFLA